MRVERGPAGIFLAQLFLRFHMVMSEPNAFQMEGKDFLNIVIIDPPSLT